MKPTTLFIDLDNTLVQNPWRSGVFPCVLDELAQASGESPEQLMQEIAAEQRRREYGTMPVDAVLAMDWDDVVRTVAARYGVAWQGDLAEVVNRFCVPPHLALLDEAHEVLADLRREQDPPRRLILATKGLSRYQMPVLRQLGLLPLIDDILSPDRYASLKIQRQFYGDYATSDGLLISVGDYYFDDVEGPIGLGFHSVWKRRLTLPEASEPNPFCRAALAPLPAGATVRPDAVIGHLSELPGVVKQLETAFRNSKDRLP